MKATLERRDQFLIARVLEDELDVGNAGALKQLLVGEIRQERLVLIVDMARIRDIDSSGLGALVAALKAVRRFGGTVRLCGVQSAVREVMELTMIHRVLEIHATVEDAMLAESGVGCGE